ncbi:MAG TPA: THUMP domain-containing protein, partial [Methanobacterium sp.]|nr:THUMP domain-containing protein [Methanobacterium sp.]
MESQINEYATKIVKLSKGNLCDRCLGRSFSKIVDGNDNKHRGEIVRKLLNEDCNSSKTDSCYICNNIFDIMQNSIIEKIISKIDEENIEFSTFLVGSRVSSEILEREEEIHESMGLDVENIKKEINREIGKELYFKLEKEVDFDYPDIV